MIEKVNPCHPDKVADRIAGAIVDLAYKKQENPKIAVEVLIGHHNCMITIESSIMFDKNEITPIVKRLAGNISTKLVQVKQDKHLASNQEKEFKCGDNGIFKGAPLTNEEHRLSQIARNIYSKFPTDGKYILNWSDEDEYLVICQSNAKNEALKEMFPNAKVNPIGEWTGGINVDSGATNRKLGSDMARSVTGGGLHGKDLSKADVSVNITCYLLAQEYGEEVTAMCAIGDSSVKFTSANHVETKAYREIVEIARAYIKELGGFEKFAEWGLF